MSSNQGQGLNCQNNEDTLDIGVWTSTDGIAYKYITINGVSCMELATDSTTPKEMAKRRKDKDILGETNYCVPMMDRKQGGKYGQMEYCDIIVFVEDVRWWSQNFIKYYREEGYLIGSTEISGGFQRIIKKETGVYVTMSFYTSKNKLMIQPGDRDEQNLLHWLKDFAIIRHNNHPNVQAAESEVVCNTDMSNCDQGQQVKDTQVKSVQDKNHSVQWNDLQPSTVYLPRLTLLFSIRTAGTLWLQVLTISLMSSQKLIGRMVNTVRKQSCNKRIVNKTLS